MWLLNAAAALLLIDVFRIERSIQRFAPVNPSRTKTRPVRADSREYYRLYKYLYLQAGIGARAEDSLGRLHRVTEHPRLRRVLYRMAEILSTSGDMGRAVDYLRGALIGADGETFVSILEGVRVSGLRKENLVRFDRMLFQKHLIDLNRRTKRIKRDYLTAVFLFCAAIFGMLFLPMMHQMAESLRIIFR